MARRGTTRSRLQSRSYVPSTQPSLALLLLLLTDMSLVRTHGRPQCRGCASEYAGATSNSHVGPRYHDAALPYRADTPLASKGLWLSMVNEPIRVELMVLSP